MLASLERAREAERRFVGDASHELRTPLTALRGNAAYVARHGADPEALADLEADAARLSALLDDLLALAREDAAAPARGGEPVDLLELARAAAERARRGRGPRPACRARASGRRSSARVGNLVAQRAQARPPEGGSRSRVAVAPATARGLTVADEGPGLTPEEAAHAFERFWRGPGARGEGSGLGLAIVRAIAERHGGSVARRGRAASRSSCRLSRNCQRTRIQLRIAQLS